MSGYAERPLIRPAAVLRALARVADQYTVRTPCAGIQASIPLSSSSGCEPRCSTAPAIAAFDPYSTLPLADC